MKILEIYQYFFMVGLGFSALNLLILALNLLALRANQKMYTEYFKDRSMANRKASIEKIRENARQMADFINPDLGKEWPVVMGRPNESEASEGIWAKPGHVYDQCPGCKSGALRPLENEANRFQCTECQHVFYRYEYRDPQEIAGALLKDAQKPQDSTECPECNGSGCSNKDYPPVCSDNPVLCVPCNEHCSECKGTGKAG